MNTIAKKNTQMSTKFKKLKTFPKSLEPASGVLPQWVFEEAIDWKIDLDKVRGISVTCFCVPVANLLRKTSKETNQEFVTSQIRTEDKTKGEVSQIADQISRMGQETAIASKFYSEMGETHIKTGNGRWRATNHNTLVGAVPDIPNITSQEGKDRIPSNYIWSYFLEMSNDMEVYDYQVAWDVRNTAQTNISKKQMKAIIRNKIRTGNLTDSQGRWGDLTQKQKIEVICHYLDNVVGGVYTGSGKNLAKDILKGQQNESIGLVTWDKSSVYKAFENHLGDFATVFESNSLKKAVESVLQKNGTSSLKPGYILENVEELGTGEKVRIGLYCNASALREGAVIQHCLLSKIVNKQCDRILLLLSFDSIGNDGNIESRREKAVVDIKHINKETGKKLIDFCAFPQQKDASPANTSTFFEKIEIV